MGSNLISLSLIHCKRFHTCNTYITTTGLMQHKSVAAFGRGSGDIVLDNVVCTSDESSIAVCRHNGFGQDNCGHDEDVVVSVTSH